MVAPLVRMIFEQPDAATAWEQHARGIELTGRFDAAADLLADAGPDILVLRVPQCPPPAAVQQPARTAQQRDPPTH